MVEILIARFPMIRNKVIYYTVIVILVAILIFSGVQVARYAIDTMQQKNAYDDLAAMVEQSRAEPAPAVPVSPTEDQVQPTAATAPAAPTEPTEPVMLPEYAALYAENPDTVGWLRIDGTVINYPVMQTPDRPDYYLKRNFQKEQNAHGCIYVRESCDVFLPSDNVTIYGHHMKNGSMFAGLDHYGKKKFWEEYPTINFDTLYERNTYTVFAVFVTTATVGKGFAYHAFEDAADAEEFDDFVAKCKELSIYDTGITPQFGDKLICLSTCEYSRTNGRLVVAAVRDPVTP